MRHRMAWTVCFLVLAVGSLATWSLLGQAPTPAPSAADTPPAAARPADSPPPKAAPRPPQDDKPARPPVSPPAAASAPLVPAGPAAGEPRGAGRSPLAEQIDFSARRGAEWLFRMNRVTGRFVYGFVPALDTVMDGDHYLRQVGAAFALARAARYTRNPNHAARATQALLALIDETVTDPADPEVRHTPLPSAAVNRLAAAGLLVLAVSELPAPQDDLLRKAEQLCNYIRQQQRPDGSLRYADDDKADPEGINFYPGEALYGLMRSQQHRPAAWKTDLVRKALGHYAPWWRAHKNMAFVPWQTAAYAEAYLRTREPAFAAFVAEMNDWLCEQQYNQLDPRHPEWLGGFMGWADGRPVAAPPQVASASYAESLAEACRVMRETADLARFRRYSDALERCLQFLTTLQYTDANTQHFNPWYRQRLLGGFHASHQDGDLRIDYTQHAVSAMVQYLTHVAP